MYVVDSKTGEGFPSCPLLPFFQSPLPRTSFFGRPGLDCGKEVPFVFSDMQEGSCFRRLGRPQELVLLLDHLLPMAFSIFALQCAQQAQQGVSTLPETVALRPAPSPYSVVSVRLRQVRVWLVANRDGGNRRLLIYDTSPTAQCQITGKAVLTILLSRKCSGVTWTTFLIMWSSLTPGESGVD